MEEKLSESCFPVFNFSVHLPATNFPASFSVAALRAADLCAKIPRAPDGSRPELTGWLTARSKEQLSET